METSPEHLPDSDATRRDLSAFTMTVKEAQAYFEQQGITVSDRSLQRYCQSRKLVCIKIDPDTREPSDKENGVYLVDPSSIPQRIKEIREKEDFTGTTVPPTTDDMSRPDATSRDTSPPDVPEEAPTPKEAEALTNLKAENQSLKIDKEVRDRMLEQMQKDRESLFIQIEKHQEREVQQAREIGQLETKLHAIEAPKPPKLTEPDIILPHAERESETVSEDEV